MKNRRRKTTASALAAVCACLAIFAGMTETRAKTVAFDGNGNTYIFQNENLREGWSINPGIYTSDGMPAYCIEPTQTLVIGQDIYETGSWQTYTGYSQQLKDLITEYSYFGYGYQDRTDPEYWYATQILIWQAINPGFADTRVYLDPAYDGSGFMSAQAYEITARISEKKKEIQKEADAFHTRPDLAYTDSRGNPLHEPLSVFAGEEIHVHDRADVLHRYEPVTEDVSFTRNGSDLTIHTESASAGSLTLRYGSKTPSITGAPLLLKAPDGAGAQSLIIRGCIENDSVKISWKAEGLSLQLHKLDSVTGSKPRGDASFSHAHYQLRNLSKDTDAGIFTIGDSGYSNVISSLNYLDTYELRETEAPAGYLRSETAVTFRLCDLDVSEGLAVMDVEDEVITGSLRIHKVIADRTSSGIAEAEEGAEFTVILKRETEDYGSFEDALAHYDEIDELHKAVLMTDQEGNAQSGQLAWGTYIVRQTRASSETLEMCSDFEVTITENRQVREVSVSNLPREYRLRIIKKDAGTGQPVSLSSASFAVYDINGQQVFQHAGTADYSTFMTTSDKGVPQQGSWFEPYGEKGTVTLPQTLPSGTYTVREIKAPSGYLLSADPVIFTTGEYTDSGLVEITFENSRCLGCLEIQKTIQDAEADTSLTDREDLSGFSFSLTAAEDIINPCDGTVVLARGSEYASLATDKNGRCRLEEIPAGSYELKETNAPEGVICSEESWSVVIDENQSTYSFEIENSTTSVSITKKDASGSEELPGALLRVGEEDGTVIDEWTSTETPHIIEGLDMKKTYILTEVITPRDENGLDMGYVKAESISFMPSETPQEIMMKDTVCTAMKQTSGEDPVTGAVLAVLDENSNVTDRWTSEETPHRIMDLEAGHFYTLHEEETPQGYYPAQDIVFTADGIQDQSIVMTDSPIRYQIVKIDERTNAPLAGVTLKLFEKEGDREVCIGEWVTENEPIRIGHLLRAGYTYRLEETEIIEGVHKAADIEFQVPSEDPLDEETVTIFMVDAAAAVSAAKTDPEGNYLSGAHLHIEDTEGNIVYSWISQDGPEDISMHVKGGSTYILAEDESPLGYGVIEPVVFTVTGTMQRTQTIHAVDRPVRLYLQLYKKEAGTDIPLGGCVMQVYSAEDDTPAYDIYGKQAAVTTAIDGSAKLILPYRSAGYYVREVRAPSGYALDTRLYDVPEGNASFMVRRVSVMIEDEKEAVRTGIPSSYGGILTALGTGMVLSALVWMRVCRGR